jgi:hypothetical protein
MRKRKTKRDSVVTTVEVVKAFEMAVGADARLNLRVEILRDLKERSRFRLRLWRLDLYHLRPFEAFHDRKKRNLVSDDEIWVEWTWVLPENDASFSATSVAAATKKALRVVQTRFASKDIGRKPIDG